MPRATKQLKNPRSVLVALNLYTTIPTVDLEREGWWSGRFAGVDGMTLVEDATARVVDETKRRKPKPAGLCATPGVRARSKKF